MAHQCTIIDRFIHMPSGRKDPPSPLTSEVAGILRAALAKQQMAQRELARTVGMSPSAVSKIFRGDGHIDLDQLQILASGLGLNARDVFLQAWQVTQR